MSTTFIHGTAEIDPSAEVGAGTMIWNWSKVREGACIGHSCHLGQGVYVDHDVVVGDRCKIQNGVSVYFGVTLGHSVFVGPHATFTNDRVPRADSEAWEVVPTIVHDRVSIGANATIICGVTLGEASVVGAGAVVTADVPPYALVVGNPARVVDYVDAEGNRLNREAVS